MIRWPVYLMLIFYANLISSTRQTCNTEEAQCIQSCCNSTDFHRINPAKCQLIWKYFNLSLDSKLTRFNGNHRYMKLMVKFWHDVNVPCLKSNDLEISWRVTNKFNGTESTFSIPEYCFSNDYKNTSDQHRMLPLNCDTQHTWHIFSRYLIITGLTISFLLLIATIFIYFAIKDLRDNMRLKIFIWYLTSLVVGHTSMITYVNIIWNSYDTFKMLSYIIVFFCSYFLMVTFLWMSVIFFEIWITFNGLHSVESLSCDKTRYTIYAIYVWSTPIPFYVLYILTQSKIWSLAPVVIILFFSCFTFMNLTYKICKTRFNVAKARQDENLATETATIILSIFFMMGIPRILFFLLVFFKNIKYYILFKYIFLSLEAPLIFKLFVLKRNVWNMVKNRIGHKFYKTCSTTVETSTPCN
ncbi:G-protein coupled receptor Mth2-like [Haematobia irritans]|uniref:G-protein coupled receptor Mth2-like n=1 Tax=Haematobia irritans TaxID=7368 RepID=UPI003F4FA814